MFDGPDTDPTPLFLALVATAVAVLVVGTVVGVVAPGAAVGGVATDDEAAHVNPEDVSSSTDLSALERRMADRLASRVRSGSVNLSREQVQRARQSLNNSRYRSLLNRYADVAEKTGKVNKSLAFRAVSANQTELARAIDRYWTLYDWYRAVESGNLSRYSVRQLWRRYPPGLPFGTTASARRLEYQWRRVNETHADLVASQRRLARLTRANVTAPLAQVNASVRTIERTQRQVRAKEFVRTNLTLESADARSRISFSDPLDVHGRLRTVDGEPLANRSVRVAVGDQRLRTRTDRAGRFDLTYRPRTLPANATSVTVRYVPANASVYLPAERTVPVEIEQVRPTASVAVTPQPVAYGDLTHVAGRVSADGVGVPNASYLVFVDGRLLTRARTGTDGRYVSLVRFPPLVEPGDRSIRVLVTYDGQALARTNGTTDVDVASTATTLDGTVTRIDDRTVRVRGRLSTTRERPVPRQRVAVTANGTVLGTATTGTGGTFTETFVVPDDVGTAGPFDSRAPVGVTLRYDADGTNLRPTAVSRTIAVPTQPVGLWAVGGLALLVVLAGGLIAGRRAMARFGGDATGAGASPTADAFERHGSSTSADVAPTTLLEAAGDRLAEGHSDAAARAAYVALRERLAGDVGRHDTRTPWEFYRACEQSDLDTDALETLRRATELYERARFASESVTADAVDALLGEMTPLADGAEESTAD